MKSKKMKKKKGNVLQDEKYLWTDIQTEADSLAGDLATINQTSKLSLAACTDACLSLIHI